MNVFRKNSTGPILCHLMLFMIMVVFALFIMQMILRARSCCHLTISIYVVPLSSLFSLFPHSCVLLFNKCFRSDCGGSPAMEPQVLQGLVTSQNLPCYCQLHGLSGTTWVFPTSPLLNRVEHQKTDDKRYTHTKTSSIVMMNKLSRSIILLAWSSRRLHALRM